MRILTNGFPTNLPDSETISQGGPANFARLFINHIIESHLEHRWVGVVMERAPSNVASIKEIFSSSFRCYFRLRVPAPALQRILKAKKGTESAVVLKAPIQRLVELIEQEKPDVVFLNGFGLLNWMLLKAAERTGTPVVIQHAGIWHKELGLHKQLYSEQGRKLMEEMEREATRIAAVEIFLNGWSRDYYRSVVAPGDVRRTEIIPLPFDFTTFRQLSETIRTSQFEFDATVVHIGVIARWDEIKNHTAILEMAKEAEKRKLPWKFHAVVEIPDTKKHDKASREYRQYIDVIKPLDRAGISDFCRSVDLLILPSLFDVSPTVVLEAIALETPIAISPTVGYVEDFMACDAASWVVNPSNAAMAVDALQNITGKKMPLRLRERLLEIHDHRMVFSKYLEIFSGANVRGLPMGEVIKVLWRQEISRFFPTYNHLSK